MWFIKGFPRNLSQLPSIPFPKGLPNYNFKSRISLPYIRHSKREIVTNEISGPMRPMHS